MDEFSFKTSKELFSRNLAEFTRRAFRYGINYSVEMLEGDSIKVTVKGNDLTRMWSIIEILIKYK